jgi:2'-5' RNA ligase/GNAT superfamily N-acetyltransferase
MDDWAEVHLSADGGTRDELHVALDLPAHVADEIEAWVKEQDWPRGTEFEDRDEYHITLLYAPEGYDEHKERDWIPKGERIPCEITGLDEFGTGDKKAIVLRLDAPEAALLAADGLDAAERRGLPINRFPGGYKPHITVVYSVRKPPYARVPKIKFKSGPSSVSTPRVSTWSPIDNTTGVPCPSCGSLWTTPYKDERIHCMKCGRTSPAPNLLNMIPVNETPDWGHDDWHFAAMDPPPQIPYYYHVAPTDARESIMQNGLTGHLGDGTSSPWAEKRYEWANNPYAKQHFDPEGQPPGNYLYSDVDDARDYAIGHPSQTQFENNEEAYDGVAPSGLVNWDESGQGYYMGGEPERPEDWDENTQGDWYDSDDYMHAQDALFEEPQVFDHNNPEHMGELAQPGFDIWRVPAHRVNVLPDPESAHMEGGWMNADQAVDKVREYANEPGEPHQYDWQDWEPEKTHPLRWYTPAHVPPDALELHEWVPPWANTSEEKLHRLENETGRMTDIDTPEYKRMYPEPLTQIHPTALPLSPPPWSLTSAWGMSTQQLTDLRAAHPNVDWLPMENDTSVSTGGYLKVAPGDRGNGYARAAMEALCDHADAVGKPIPLNPTNEWGASRRRLEQFYRSLGFVPNRGRNKDFAFRDSWIRQPNPRS